MAYTTALTGLTAQGIDAFTGLCYSNNDVSFTMSSSESAQPAFKYIVQITDNRTTEQYKFYVAANAVGSGIFNVKTLFNQLVQNSIVFDNTDDVVLQTSTPILTDKNNVNNFTINLYEGYEVGGIFTEDNSVEVIYNLMCIYGSGKQNFIVMGTNDTRPLALSQNYDNEIGFSNETLANKLVIPSLLQSEIINWKYISRTDVNGATDSAYDIHAWIADDNSFINSNYPYNSIDHFTFDLYDENQTLLDSFDIPMTFAGGSLLFLPTGLKNLVNGGYVDEITADSTAFYVYAGYNVSDEQVTTKYGYYLSDDCKYNPVHVYWLNQMGGWDSYSFIKRNERSIEVERKRYKAYQGDFNNATSLDPYTTKNYTRELTEREPIVNTFINLTSDWLCESEYKYMKDLFMSKSVWMVDDNVDGYSIVPVVVEDNGFLMKRERNSKKYNQNIRLQIASNNETINITAAEYPIPQPTPCVYYDTFSKYTGTISTSVGANVGNACNIIFNMAGKTNNIVVFVEDGSGNTPIAGQTYYVKVEYSSNLPYPNGKPGRIELGNVLTGGGTLTEFQMNDYTTPIIASGVWGTSPTAISTFKIQLPTWVGAISSKWSGNFYVTVGFGNCP
jgi:hypothetical protein